MKLKLQASIVLAVIIGLLIPVSVTSLFNLRYREQALTQRLESDHERLTDILALGMKEPLWTFNPEIARPLFESMLSDPRVVAAEVRDNKLGVFLYQELNQRRVGQQFKMTRDVVHIDVAADPEYELREVVEAGFRTVLSVPMFRDGNPIGVIAVTREEGRPFTPQQIALLRTFADQAVIAIENVRLFQELQERNRDLTEALDQQTATGEILRVISSSPTDVQPVFEAIVRSAVALCEGVNGAVHRFDGSLIHLMASHGVTAEERSAVEEVFPIPPGRSSATARAIATRAVAHVPDMLADPEYAYAALVQAGFRTSLSIPMLRAVPAIILTAAGRSWAFKSGILSLAISSTWALVTEPTLFLLGTPEPFSILAALIKSIAAGGVLVINVKDRS